MDDALVKVSGVSKTYPQGSTPVLALRGLNLEVKAGEFTAFVGPSGSGKTTLLNLIGALDTPDTGDVLIEGESLRHLPRAGLAKLRLRKLGFVFQDFNLIPVLSAQENVEYVLVLHKVPAAERRSRAEEVLDAVGLADCRHRRPGQLSGGQQQRVAVARAIVGEPALVLADEPTANLDSDTGGALLDLMLSLNRTRRTTFLFSTHDAMVMRHARRVVRLTDGRVVDDSGHALS